MFEQIMWYIFIPSAIIYIVNIIMSIIGLNGSYNSSELFTFRNFVCFTFGHSSGVLIAIIDFMKDEYVATGIGTICGLSLVLITRILFYILETGKKD